MTQYSNPLNIIDFLSIHLGKENFNNQNAIGNVENKNDIINNIKQIVEQSLPPNFQYMDTRQLLSLTGENVLEKIPSEIADESLNGMLKLMIKEIILVIHDKQPDRKVVELELMLLALNNISENILNANNQQIASNLVNQYLNKSHTNQSTIIIANDIVLDAISKIPKHILSKTSPKAMSEFRYLVKNEVDRVMDRQPNNSQLDNSNNQLNNQANQLNHQDNQLLNNSTYNTNLIAVTPPDVKLAPYVEIFPQIYRHQSKNVYYYYDQNSGILTDIEYPSTQPDMVVGDVVDILEKHKVSLQQIDEVEDIITEELCEIDNEATTETTEATEATKETDITQQLNKMLNKKYEVCSEKEPYYYILISTVKKYRVVLSMTTFLIIILIILLIHNLKK